MSDLMNEEDYAELAMHLSRIVLQAHRSRRRGGASGQMITEWTCAVCKMPDTHANTAVPLVCRPCEQRLERVAWPRQGTGQP